MKRILFGLTAGILLVPAFAQETFLQKPRIVVGIVVDQMRTDYIYRYYEKFGEDGFKRILRDGYSLSNAHYDYIPTVTGCGHASVYTGGTPSTHGIIGNSWYDKDTKKMVNCVEDSARRVIGKTGAGGNVSPWRMLSTTITDELKLATQKHARVIGVSIKDRGAVLPGGHMANGAYWFDGDTGNFVTSTFYMEKLPAWVSDFNLKRLPDEYLAGGWTPLLPMERYTESESDDSHYEALEDGMEKSTFPYIFQNRDYAGFTATPFANDYVTEFAKGALIGEELGTDNTPDFLCISYSATDILGHRVGPNAVELEDMYIRLDRNIADLLATLDTQVGKGNYLVFLTADHGVAEVPRYLQDNKVPAGYFRRDLKTELNEFLTRYFNRNDIVENISNGQVFLNHDYFQYEPKVSGIDLLIATELTGNYLMTVNGISNYYTKAEIRRGVFEEQGQKGMIIRGYNHRRSGDIAFLLEPGWFSGSEGGGTTHGSGYTYDTHVPMLFYGTGIPTGTSSKYHSITDIAPTVAIILGTKFPSGCSGQPISEMIDK